MIPGILYVSKSPPLPMPTKNVSTASPEILVLLSNILDKTSGTGFADSGASANYFDLSQR